MDCDDRYGEQNVSSDTQILEDTEMKSEEMERVTSEEKDCIRTGSPQHMEPCEEVAKLDTVSVTNPSTTADGLLSTSEPLDSDDLTPELLVCSTHEEGVMPSENLSDNCINTYRASAGDNISLEELSSTGGNASTLEAELSRSMHNNADSNSDSASITPSSTPVIPSQTKLQNIRFQSTPSAPEDSQDHTRQLSFSTPDFFLTTDNMSHGSPLLKENTSLSDYDLLMPQKDHTVSLSPDIIVEKSPERSDDANQSRLECDGKFKVPHQLRQPEKRAGGDFSDNAEELPCAAKRICLNGADSRKSVTIVKEIRKSPPPLDSQDVHLEYIASQPDLSSDSIVPLDEEDEIMEVSAEPKAMVPEITLDASDRTPSPLKDQNSAETIAVSPPADSSRKTREETKSLLLTLTFAIECNLTTDAETGKLVDCGILLFEGRDTSITDNSLVAPNLEDSSGVLADESSPQRSNRDSISSTISGPEPFRLQPSTLQRMSMFSTTSSSSTGSANNALPNKGLPKSNKSVSNYVTPMAEWSPGISIQNSLKASLKAYLETDSVNRKTKRKSDASSSLSKKSTSDDDIDCESSQKVGNKIPPQPLSPVHEEVLSNGNKKTKKNSPRTPSRRTPSQRLQTRKGIPSGPETPKSERKRRGRPPASPAVKEAHIGTPTTPSAGPSTTEWPGTPTTPGSSAYQPGVKVFAMWTDRKFYPAELIGRVRDSCWQVLFLSDKKQKVLPERSIVLFNTFECDQAVLASTPNDDFYKTGIITNVTAFETKDDVYTVKLEDKSTVEVTWKDLSLTEAQAQNLLDSHVKQKPTSAKRLFTQMINLDNVVHGKRLRSSKCSSPTLPSSSKNVTPASLTLEEADEPDICLRITGIEQESPNVDPCAGKGSKRTKGRKGSTADKPRDSEEEKLLERLGPIPPSGSNLFSGLTFFITSTSFRLQHEHKSLDANVSSSSMSDSDGYTDCECYSFSTLPMVKPRLASQLIAGGGRVLKNVDELEPDFDKKKVFVVTDRPCRTAVYIRCMALGIRSILHDWIVDCCKEKKNLNVQQLSYLPAGYSHVRRRFIQWSEIKAPTVFADKGILIESRNRSFVNFWAKVVRSAGGTITEDFTLTTIIVGERPFAEMLRLKAEAANIPIVSADWITQSIINGETISADEILTFSLQYSESE